MKILCIIGLAVILAVFFLAALPLMSSAIVWIDDDPETGYMHGLMLTMIVVIVIISTVIVNFYFTPEFFGYQKIVSENCVESED